MKLLKKTIFSLFAVLCGLIIFSCSKPIVINNKIDFSPDRQINSEIDLVMKDWKSKINFAEKNKDITILWQIFSSDFKTTQFYNVYDFFKAKWESVYFPLFQNIARTEVRDIKYSGDRPAATLTLLNESVNSGKPIYMTICREQDNIWKIDGFSNIEPDVEKYRELLEKTAIKDKKASEVLANLENLIISEDFTSAYHLAYLLLEKSVGAGINSEKESARLINSVLKISNFYFYLYSKTRLKSYLFENIKLLENVFRLSVYDSKVFYTLGYAHILNGNLQSANSYFDRALQIIKPAPENYEYIKNILTHIIDIHLISNEWNAAAGKLKSLESIFAEHQSILNLIIDYKNSWPAVLKYNCKDIIVKYRAIEYYKTLQFDSAAETLVEFRKNFPESYYSEYADFLHCLSRYYIYANSDPQKLYASSDALRFECERSAKTGLKYLPLIYSMYMETFLKEGDNFSDFDNARKLYLKFNQLYDGGRLDPSQMLYLQLSVAKTYHLLKLWEQSLIEYKKIRDYLKVKKFLNPEEKDIQKYVNVIIENQANSGYLAFPYIGAQLEQGSPFGNIIVKKIIDNPALMPGDIILSINSIPVNSLINCYTILNSYKIGSSIKLKIFRKNVMIDVSSVIKDYI